VTNAALKPRKQPRQRRSQDTYDVIVEAAAQVIATHGLHGFNTNAVAARAGVSIGSLYQYFPHKDALMVALIHRQISSQLGTFRDAIEANLDSSLSQTVRALVSAAMAHHYEDPLFATAIDHEEARLDIQEDLNNFLHVAGLGLESVFERHRSEIGDICANSAATTLPQMVRAIVDVWANQHPPQLQKAEDEAVRAVMGYLIN
jgi:AcrR family transcriptional regulator